MDPFIEKYEIGDDAHLDGLLFKYELAASQAHGRMLHKIGILSPGEQKDISDRIKKFYSEYGDTIDLEAGEEDIHSKLEAMLIAELGEAGKKIHTGRSRNDQVMVVTRLQHKDAVLDLALHYHRFLEELIAFIKREGGAILPGYTHTKQAMLVTAGFWAQAFLESGLDNLRLLDSIYSLIDQNPLGTGSGFGVPLDLDRDYTSQALGFNRTQNNAMYTHNTRGKMEALLADACWAIMTDLSRMAADLLMYNMDEALFVQTDTAITTGSSIMPQKRNLDVMELVRARTHKVMNDALLIKSTINGLHSGYNRDLQEIKKPLQDAFDTTIDSIQACSIVLQHISIDEEAVTRSLSPGIFATDIAFEAVAQGMPFRDAYKSAAARISSIIIDKQTISDSITKRISQGSPATVDTTDSEKSVSLSQKHWEEKKTMMSAVYENLLK